MFSEFSVATLSLKDCLLGQSDDRIQITAMLSLACMPLNVPLSPSGCVQRTVTSKAVSVNFPLQHNTVTKLIICIYEVLYVEIISSRLTEYIFSK